nr:transcriptional regulator [Saliphagus sp. LR7]
MESSLDDIEFLARSEHRVNALVALTEGSYDRRDLQNATGASVSTISRVLTDLEDRHWITRNPPRYELTPLGTFVTERFLDLHEAIGLERTLRDVWQWLPRDMDGFSVELFDDVVVSYPGPAYPYQPVERVTHLLEHTETIRGLGTTIYKSGNIEVFCRRVIEGMEMEYVYAPSVLRAIIVWNPDLVTDVFACENCTILLHDDLPDGDRCGLNVMDDYIGICGHERETAQLKAVIDTQSPEARAWATDVYERYRSEARPFDPNSFETGDQDSRRTALRVEV